MKKIMIVEDESIVAEDIKVSLISSGYDVCANAKSGEEAIIMAEEIRPDLILMDIVLEGEMDGITAAEEIKSRFDIPVIYLTAHATKEYLDRAKITEPFGYFTKPVVHQELKTNIEVALYKHGMEKELKESEDKFKKLTSSALDAIIMMNGDGNITFWNEAAERIFGYSKKEAIGKNLHKLIVPERFYDDFMKGIKVFMKTGEGAIIGQTIPIQSLKRDGTEFIADHSFSSVKIKGQWHAISIIRDDTERKKAEKLLQEQRNALEQKNIALHEVLGQIEIEKKQIKDNVVSNAENLLLPIIERLKLKGESRKYVKLLQNSIHELASSFGTKLTEIKARLTPREIEICNMIKNGLTNKEIASLLNITLQTTERHRANIRNKLGIVKKDMNLTSYLNTL